MKIKLPERWVSGRRSFNTLQRLAVYHGKRADAGSAKWRKLGRLLQPAMPVTRFSSYHILRETLSRKERRAATVFYGMFESVSRRGDDRETPAKRLPLRTTINVPKGTTFSLDDSLLTELLERGEVTEREQNEIVAALSMNGKDYEFSFSDFKIIAARFMKDGRKTLSDDPVQAGFELVMEMYLQRFPYEESEFDLPQP